MTEDVLGHTSTTPKSRFGRAVSFAKKALITAVTSPMTLVQKARAGYDHFETTLEEAHYLAEPRSVFDLFKADTKRLPETAPVQVSTRMLGTSEKVGQRFLWGSVFAILSFNTLVTAAAVLAVAGVGILAMEYQRAKRVREEVITETNFAGQQVRGTRADLCRLHKAQMDIINIGDTFKKASMESTSDTIRNIMERVAGERARVTVIDQGPYNTLKDSYDFSRPAIQLVDEDERAPEASLETSPEPSAAAQVISVVEPAQDEIFSPAKTNPLRERFHARRQREIQQAAQALVFGRDLSPALRRRLKSGLYGTRG